MMSLDSFSQRHLGVNTTQKQEMLNAVKADCIEDLVQQIIPESILLEEKLKLPTALTEFQYSRLIQELSLKNTVFRSYIGLGYHESYVPAAIQRNILENPSWYTAYTPYQAEIAQGRLEALLNYQTLVCELTGMELANASLLDEATAAAEAMSMLFSLRSRQQKKNKVSKFMVSDQILPQTLSVLKTRAIPLGIELHVVDCQQTVLDDSYFGVILQYPCKNGEVIDYTELTQKAKAFDIKVVVAADLLSLTLLKEPSAFGADVVVGTTQRFGIPLGYGGPHAAYFATKTDYKRSIPGRIIGVTKDQEGKRALRMALQTREQHIKRDKATSNICTAQVLLAVMASMYGVYHGSEGLENIAQRIHNKAFTLDLELSKLGYQQNNKVYFDTLLVEVSAQEKEAIQSFALDQKINFHYSEGQNTVSISLNEVTTLKDLSDIISVFSKAKDKPSIKIEEVQDSLIISDELKRTTDFLKQDVFCKYHTETELMRYIKKLERKDLALNHAMIPLGSCTMKLNAASQMLPLSNPQWNNIHPFVPLDQVKGYAQVLKELENYLTEITGFAATSLQPNSGAQGEFAGLMVIRAYHLSRNEPHRNICLIPSSAHGTNPASAIMAGMKVVVVKVTEQGNINLDDLKEKADKYKDQLAALMITYPSTHGVYESEIIEVTKTIHDNGGQVYMDGANMNAQVGLTHPKRIGADVCHLNLHKTFAIPHGGGGPGVGPICVASQLKDFLPKHPLVNPNENPSAIEAISAAPWGSALACLISYGYIRMLGVSGLKKATQIAILNANYIQYRLKDSYPILYTGDQNRVAHEMIIDCRPFKEKGIEVTDIAKRLMDYGFHAPTVSFPVAGTMMIEPTESESKEELDRFCDAMIAIRQEIEASTADNPNTLLKNAPHTLAMITADHWGFSYTRQQAAYPLDYVRENKFWPSVRRLDEAFGDRNLICTCTPMEEYALEEEAVL